MSDLTGLLGELSGENVERAEVASAELVHHGQEAIQHLRVLAKQQDADKRWWVIRTLSNFDDPAAIDTVIDALEDENTAVRQCAALGLSKHPHIDAIQPLAVLLGSHDHILARLAGNALVAIGTEAVPELISRAESANLQTSSEAARCLALIGDTRAIPTLFGMLDSESALIEHWASQGLEKMGVGMSFFHVQ